MASANFHSLQPGPECETISHSALPPPAKSVVSIGVWDTSFVAKQLRIVLSGPNEFDVRNFSSALNTSSTLLPYFHEVWCEASDGTITLRRTLPHGGLREEHFRRKGIAV